MRAQPSVMMYSNYTSTCILVVGPTAHECVCGSLLELLPYMYLGKYGLIVIMIIIIIIATLKGIIQDIYSLLTVPLSLLVALAFFLCLSMSVSLDTLACCWDVKQPASNNTSLSFCQSVYGGDAWCNG